MRPFAGASVDRATRVDVAVRARDELDLAAERAEPIHAVAVAERVERHADLGLRGDLRADDRRAARVADLAEHERAGGEHDVDAGDDLAGR